MNNQDTAAPAAKGETAIAAAAGCASNGLVARERTVADDEDTAVRLIRRIRDGPAPAETAVATACAGARVRAR